MMFICGVSAISWLLHTWTEITCADLKDHCEVRFAVLLFMWFGAEDFVEPCLPVMNVTSVPLPMKMGGKPNQAASSKGKARWVSVKGLHSCWKHYGVSAVEDDLALNHVSAQICPFCSEEDASTLKSLIKGKASYPNRCLIGPHPGKRAGWLVDWLYKNPLIVWWIFLETLRNDFLKPTQVFRQAQIFGSEEMLPVRALDHRSDSEWWHHGRSWPGAIPANSPKPAPGCVKIDQRVRHPPLSTIVLAVYIYTHIYMYVYICMYILALYCAIVATHS